MRDADSPTAKDGTDALPHQDAGARRSGRDTKVTLVGALDLPLKARLTLFYNGSSGAPFTYRVEGDANADGVTAFGGLQLNDPVYVPRDAADITLAEPDQWADPDNYIRSHPCLREQRGQLLRRNSCRNPWVSLMNARVSTVFPTVRGQSVELIADLFNGLNFLDGEWAVRRSIGGTAILRLVGYDPVNQRGIYVFQTRDANRRDLEATRSRMQVGRATPFR